MRITRWLVTLGLVALLCASLGCEERRRVGEVTPTHTLAVASAPETSTPLQAATRPASPTALVAAPATAALQPEARPTAIPTATATSLPTASPTAEGRLISVAAELDLALPHGNLLSPIGATLDPESRTMWVMGALGGNAPQGYGVARVSAETLQVEAMTPISGYSAGSMAAGGGFVYLTHWDDQGKTILSALRAGDLGVAAEAELGQQAYSTVLLQADPARKRLLLSLSDKLQVYEARSLALLDTVPYGVNAPRQQMLLDERARRLYISLGGELRAYAADDLSLVWAQPVGQGLSLESVGLALDAVGGLLHAQAQAYQDGDLRTWLQAVRADDGELVGERVLLDTSAGWPVLVGASPEGRYIVSSSSRGACMALLDPMSAVKARYELGHGYGNWALHDPARGRLYLPDSTNHLLAVLEERTLARAGEITVGVEVRDILLAGERAYVSDSTGRVRVLERQTHALLGEAVAGRGKPLVLDEARGRLYVPVDEGQRRIAVLDTSTLRVTQVITGGERIALDQEHGRAFVGYPASSWLGAEAEPGATVRVLDADSLREIATIPQGGIPAYNPRRNEIYITDYTVFIYDGERLQAGGELTPDIGEQPLRGCNGCRAARDVYVYPELDLLIADVTVLSAGKGWGTYPPPRFYSLRTLEPRTYPVAAGATCAGKFQVSLPVGGVIYDTTSYSRYAYHLNLVAREAGTENVLRWVDGLSARLVLPEAGVIYSDQFDRALLALDMETWAPLGTVPWYCFHTVDRDRGWLYAIEGSRLIILRDRGGQPQPGVPEQPVERLAGIRGIYPSPDYARDLTLFLDTDKGLARSADGGRTWRLVADDSMGLTHSVPNRRLVFSPDYARDHTIYATAFTYNGTGYGVLRSTDAGAHWERLWSGLDHLRVERVVLSPQWAQDGEMLTYARYARLAPTMESGVSLYRSRDRGAHWELAAQRADSAPDAPALPEPEAIWGADKAQVRARLGPTARTVELTRDGGESWTTALQLPETDYLLDVLTAPGFPEQGAVYAYGGNAVYRSQDGGATWELARNPAGLEDYERLWRAVALLPQPDGGHQLAFGDQQGNLTIAVAETLSWRPVAEPRPSPTLPPSPPPPPTAEAATPTPAPACAIAPWEGFVAEALTLAEALGCPVAEAQSGQAATQAFEHGRMFWRADQGRIYAMFESGYWIDVEDTWREDQPAYDPTLAAPVGLQQPVRGFGKVWREYLRGPDTAMGWATQAETPYTATWQFFQGGILITDEAGNAYALRQDHQSQP